MTNRISKSVTICLVTFSLATACSKKAGDAGPTNDDPKRRATPEECQKAYEHLAELRADNDMSKDDVLKTERGNIESCPQTQTKKSIDCLRAINAPADKSRSPGAALMNAEMDCAMKK